MAVTRKGWRRIAVGDGSYSWRAIGRDWGIEVVVVTDAAFARGTKSQQLRFTLYYDHLEFPEPGRVRLRQRAAVAPGVVRRAIHVALSLASFTGEPGAPDVVLSGEVLALVQAAARSVPADE